MKKTVLALLLLAVLVAACGNTAESPVIQEIEQTAQDTEPAPDTIDLMPDSPTVESISEEQPALSAIDGEYKISKIDRDELESLQQIDLPQLHPEREDYDFAIMETSMGVMKFALYSEYTPKAVENFIGLAEKGFYDGLTFHNIINGYAIQSGDPLGNGSGGESLWGEPFEAELTGSLHHFRGAISMSNSGDGMNLSQFFVVASKTIPDEFDAEFEEILKDLNQMVTNQNGDTFRIGDMIQEETIDHFRKDGGAPELDYFYTVFGQLVEGYEVLDVIAAATTDENGMPLSPITINKITIQRKPVD